MLLYSGVCELLSKSWGIVRNVCLDGAPHFRGVSFPFVEVSTLGVCGDPSALAYVVPFFEASEGRKVAPGKCFFKFATAREAPLSPIPHLSFGARGGKWSSPRRARRSTFAIFADVSGA